MSARISTERGVLIILFAAVVVIYFGYGPDSQLGRMQRATDHAAKLRPMLESDARFALVHCGRYTGGGGMLGVTGLVENQADLDRLQAIVGASNPPVETYWHVRVVGEEEFRRVRERKSGAPQTAPTHGAMPN